MARLPVDFGYPSQKHPGMLVGASSEQPKEGAMIKRISAFIYGSVYYGIAHLAITTRRSNHLHSAPEREGGTP